MVGGDKDSIPGFSITDQENDDMFIKKGSNMFVEHIAVNEFISLPDFSAKLPDCPAKLPDFFAKLPDN